MRDSNGREMATKEEVGGHRSQTAGRLVLFDNVQFIYELALAQMELLAFGAEFQIDNGMREFKVSHLPDEEALLKRTAYFKAINGQPSFYSRITRRNRTRSVNQYLTHWIYPYKGKFHPQMIRALMNIIGLKEGDRVLDPFIGSGTTAVEANLLGIDCIGFDISPVCVLQSKVKVESVRALHLIERLKDMVMHSTERSLFNPEADLNTLIDSIGDEITRNFYKMALLVTTSDQARRKRDFRTSFIKNINRMAGSVRDYDEVVRELKLRTGRIEIRIGDARKLPLPDASVDGVITSPPYSIALDYIQNDLHALEVIGIDADSLRAEMIGLRGKGKERIRLYEEDMAQAYKEMARVLKAGKYAVIIIGNPNYNGEVIDIVGFTVRTMESLGLKLWRNIDKLIYGLYNIMQRENILIFRKGE